MSRDSDAAAGARHIAVLAAAKINFGLAIVGLRPDGLPDLAWEILQGCPRFVARDAAPGFAGG